MAFPWAVQAGPGRFDWDGPSLASTRDLRVGPDTGDGDALVLVRDVNVVTEEQIADLSVTQTRHRRMDGRAAVSDYTSERLPFTDAGERSD